MLLREIPFQLPSRYGPLWDAVLKWFCAISRSDFRRAVSNVLAKRTSIGNSMVSLLHPCSIWAGVYLTSFNCLFFYVTNITRQIVFIYVYCRCYLYTSSNVKRIYQMGDGRWKCFKSFYIKSRADRFCDDIFERGAVLKLTIDINWFNK